MTNSIVFKQAKDNKPREADPTKTKALREEYVREFKKPVRQARKDIKAYVEVNEIDQTIIPSAKNIVDKHLNETTYAPIISRYSYQFWIRGDKYAKQKLNQAGVQINIVSEFAVSDPATLEALESMQLDLVKGLSEKTKKDLAFQLGDGLLRGEGKRKLMDRITKVFHTSLNRAELIARTESIRVFNQAAVIRYRSVGIMKYRWLTSLSGRTCPRCAALHGKIVEGNEIPPLHPRCVCTIEPVVDMR